MEIPDQIIYHPVLSNNWVCTYNLSKIWGVQYRRKSDGNWYHYQRYKTLEGALDGMRDFYRTRESGYQFRIATVRYDPTTVSGVVYTEYQ